MEPLDGGPADQRPPPHDGSHPDTSTLENQTPNVVTWLYHTGFGFLQMYGWFAVFGIVILLILKNRLQPVLDKFKKKREQQQQYENYDPDVARQRSDAMETARRRQQEKYDSQTEKFAEEQKKKEEEKRKAKIEDWDNHLQGKGYRSKYRPPEEGSAPQRPSQPQSKKPVYRSNDYNPLSGTSGGGGGGGGAGPGFRPSRRGGASGGG